MDSNMNPALIISLLFSVVFPLGLLIWWKKKTGEKLWCFIAGAVCFTLFAMVLESMLHQVVLDPASGRYEKMMSSPVLYMLYGAFAAGIFEETGRLFGYKILLKNRREKECAVAYGIGHGGIEVIYVLGSTYLLYVLVACGVPVTGTETDALMAQAAASITLGLTGVAMLERVSAIMLHIGLSMLMFPAAKQKGKLWLWPAAICLHALADAPAALYQAGVIRSVFVIEGFTFVFGLAVLFAGIRTLKGYRESGTENSDCCVPEEAAE